LLQRYGTVTEGAELYPFTGNKGDFDDHFRKEHHSITVCT